MDLTARQAEIFATVDHFYQEHGEPCSGSYVARKLNIAKQVVQGHFEALHRKGWLRGPGSPAVPSRPLPARHGGMTKSHLPETSPACDVLDMAKRTAQAPAAATPAAQMIEMGPLTLRAEIRSDGINREARTAEVVFSTGAGVDRFDWWTGKRYVETLSLEPGAVRLKRLNNSAPLLDAHSSYELRNQIGVVVPKSARIENGQAIATVRFSKRADVEPLFQDVVDGIIRNVSVGYKVHKYEKTEEEGKPELRHAVDWEPYEISAVPMGADDDAKFRGQKPTDTNPCEIVMRGVKETRMDPEETPSETIAETDPLTPPAKRSADPPEPNEHEAGAVAENERIEGIRSACLAARLPRSFEDKLIKDRKLTLVKAQGMVFDELRKRGGDDRGPGRIPAGDVEVGADPLIHVRAGIENAILHRVKPESFKLEDVGKPYRGMTLLDIGRAYLHARGIRTTGFSKMELAAAALGLTERQGSGMHTTSDFANLLADVANKTLRAAYEEAPQTFGPISRRVTLPDFKPVKRLQIGDAPQLLEIKEHGEFTRGTIGEGKEQFQLATFGRIFAITRKSLVNDDTSAFSRIAVLFGRAARTLESDLVWQQITSNPNMGDGVALFHTTHANLDAVAAAIAIGPIGKGRAAMRNQKAIDGVTLMNVAPSFLVVPPALETVADQFVSTNLAASQPSNVNPFAGRLQVISEPRLEVVSATAWFLAAVPSVVDVIEYGTLEGDPGPVVESRIGFDIDGLEVKCRHDFAAKVIDWRGLFKNPGL